MQILRRGGEYLEAREYWQWTALTIVVLVATVALAFGLRSSEGLTPEGILMPLGPVMLGLLVGRRPLRRIVARIRAVRKGRLGERLVTDLLTRLPGHYYLVNDVVLGAGNIDHVVTGPCGIVVIETKRVAGRIRCDGDTWTVNGRRSKSYSRQIKAGAVAIKTFLAARHPELKGTFVRAIVVFTDPLCHLDVNRAEVAVARFSELLPLMNELGRVRQLDDRLARAVAHSLAGTAANA